MTGKIYPSLFLSLFFHGLFILALIFGVRNSVKDFKNLTYVTLIHQAGNSSQPASLNEENKTQTSSTKQSVQESKEISKKPVEKTQKTSREDEQLLQERIAALRAKKKILERAQAGSVELKSGQTSKGAEVSSSYLALISGIIRQNWSVPDTVSKNLEAVVSVRILSNGHVIVEGFEKKSGNIVFDSSVLVAIRNSSPLPPPRSEVVVGLRFKP
ncbi:colicin import membrane protein [Thermodesulfovibrio aggregans]|uniref:Colicin import membrane protein n=1 Tax=Thermodesulfovibrio aggregans TaxID=86166 RepID=A0A0U9HRN2_9BACT|nr:TonB C-terminal domain-containing protein [Thermodesulfovibrio aggregans]GAQ94410.1 colicin import membrane protein [Thermodesulfovibrio aggregans]